MSEVIYRFYHFPNAGVLFRLMCSDKVLHTIPPLNQSHSRTATTAIGLRVY